ncbi:hypothetical protein SAMN02745146_0716 [Hymenobacter daecheongensis DSM 21074]|uniref:Uncharacterized protein n=2 Tax=Hymenobacter daecheongensis TaxID=496053 RepID=A0A1M6AP94_9BACT|nr:hypothetical protein SAMN02745146_0716 [Hymenobacter daecheongensis DSM 21074]
MRPDLHRLHWIEHHLLGHPTPAEAADWRTQQLVDAELAADTEIQRQLYQGLYQAGRQQLRWELDQIHARLQHSARRRGWLQAATDVLRRTLRLLPGR